MKPKKKVSTLFVQKKKLQVFDGSDFCEKGVFSFKFSQVTVNSFI